MTWGLFETICNSPFSCNSTFSFPQGISQTVVSNQRPNRHPHILWGLRLLDRLCASSGRNTLQTTISHSIWIDFDGTVESTLRVWSQIQVQDLNSGSEFKIRISILDPGLELIWGKNDTGVRECDEHVCSVKNMNIRKCSEWNSGRQRNWPPKCSKRPQNPHNRILREKLYAQMWSQIIRPLDR